MHRSLIALSPLCLFALSCTAPDFVDPPAPPPSFAVPLDELTARYTKALCQARAECGGPFLLRHATSIDFAGGCEQRARPYVDLAVEHYLKPAVARGTVLYDPQAAGAYIRSLPGTYCTAGKTDERYSLELGPAIVPLLNSGDACFSSVECGAALYCDVSSSCPGRCTVQKASGADCTDEEECLAGYSCTKGKCLPKRGPTESCGGAEPDCQHPMRCAYVLGLSLCYSPGALATSEAGDRCLPLSDVGQCRPGLGCQPDDPNNALLSTCRAPGAVGAPCALLSTLDGCADGAYCQPPSQGMVGTCAPTPQAGQPCAENIGGERVCSGGLVCNAAKLCALPRALGEPCTGEGECVGGTCAGGVCQPSPTGCFPR